METTITTIIITTTTTTMADIRVAAVAAPEIPSLTQGESNCLKMLFTVQFDKAKKDAPDELNTAICTLLT